MVEIGLTDLPISGEPPHPLGSAMGPFKNYVDKILTYFDYLPALTWTFFTLNMDKKEQVLTTHPPHLVHRVIIEKSRGGRFLWNRN